MNPVNSLMANQQELKEKILTPLGLEESDANTFWTNLQLLVQKNRPALAELLESSAKSGQCVLGAALVISGAGTDGDERCEKEACLIEQAFREATGKEVIIKLNPTRDEFFENVEEFIEQMEHAHESNGSKDFLFYYAGEGCEFPNDGVFRFVPSDSKRTQDYITLVDVMHKIDQRISFNGCQVIFGIDACRDYDPDEEAAVPVHEGPHQNKYPRFFSTQPRASAAHDGKLKLSPFAEKMERLIPQMTSSELIPILLHQASGASKLWNPQCWLKLLHRFPTTILPPAKQ